LRYGVQKKRPNGQRGKLFPAIHFPFRFPRPYRSPYLSNWGPLGTDPFPTRFNSTEHPIDLSTVHEMWREACTAGGGKWWENWQSKAIPGAEENENERPESAPLSTITLLMCRFPRSSTPTCVGFAYLFPPSLLTPPPLRNVRSWRSSKDRLSLITCSSDNYAVSS
jgi:hypothetical protein